MYFLNPSILIALSAVSIPVIIHLFNLQKIRKVEFSTLMFLKELQKSKIKRIKLKQLLLLLLRMLVIILLVLSFAKPVYKGYAGSSAVDEKKTVFIVLDNSFSMSAKDDNGSYLEQSKDAVKRILAAHSESDEIYFIRSSDILLKEKKTFYSSKRELLDSLESAGSAQYSFKDAVISEQLNIADEIFSSSANRIKELFIISDFQRSNFQAAVSNSLKERNVNVFLVNAGERKVNNISLDSVTIVSKILEKDREIKLKVLVNNHTDYNVVNKVINLYAGDELLEEKAIDINSLEKKEAEFSLKLNKTGYINGYFELLRNEFFEDEIPEDNKFYFTLYVPESFKIGIVEETADNSKYLRLAFSIPGSGSGVLPGMPDAAKFFDLSETGINSSLNDFDLAFITGKKSISESEAEILKDYIANGGGVFILPSEGIDAGSYNRFLSGINSSLLGNLNESQSVNANLKFDRIDFEHPVLSEVFQNQKLSLTEEQFNIESPLIHKYFDLLPGQNSSPIITLSNGKPFLTSARFNSGKILVSSISAGTSMSDFQSKSIFLPLIIRSAYYLGSNYEQDNENYVGGNNLIMLNGINEIISIRAPGSLQEKNELSIAISNGNSNYLSVPYERFTSMPGVYELADNENKTVEFSLNHNPAESRLEKMDEAELIDFFEELGFSNVFFVNSGETVTANVTEARTGLELWKYLLIAALIFLALEIFLSKRMEKE